MHVRLKIFNSASLAKRRRALADERRVRRNIDVAAPTGNGVEESERLAIFRLLPFWIKINSKLDLIGDLFTYGMVVNFENDLRSGHHQLSGIGTHDLALLTDRPFHEETACACNTRCGA